jgi:hypothetical protein
VSADTNSHHDASLIDYLDKGEFAKISDDHVSRLDQGAAITAFGTARCRVEKGSDSDFAYLESHLMSYLEGGSDLKNRPHDDQLINLSIAAIRFRPVHQTMVAEIVAESCSSERIQRIGRNLLKLMRDRMHAEATANVRPPHKPVTQIDETTLDEQKLLPFDQSDGFRYAVFETSDRAMQHRILQQFKDLNVQGRKLIACSYKGPQGYAGPFLFWYKDVAISRAELLKVSAKHPLSQLGDFAITACPAKESGAIAKMQQ